MSSTYTDTPMMRAFAAAVTANVPVLFWGNPGVGKTARLTSYGQAWGRHVETIVGSVRESSDYLGLPVVTADDTVVYSPLAWARRLVDADKGLLFLDELTTAPSSVRKAMLRVIQEREVGELTLPDTVALVAAANPPEVGVDAYELDPPMANRFLHLDWVFDSTGWFDGLLTDFTDTHTHSITDLLGQASESRRANARGLVAGFLRHLPHLLAPEVPTDPDHAGKAWPSPRSWHNAAKVLGELSPDDVAAWSLVLTGLVGEGPSHEFIAWMRTADLADPETVIADPSVIAWADERPDRLFALTTSIASYAVSRADAGVWERAVGALVVCADSGKPDVALPAMTSLVGRVPAGAELPSGARAAFTDLFTRTGAFKAPAAV